MLIPIKLSDAMLDVIKNTSAQNVSKILHELANSTRFNAEINSLSLTAHKKEISNAHNADLLDPIIHDILLQIKEQIELRAKNDNNEIQ